MLVSEYFSRLEKIVVNCPAVINNSILFDQRSRHIGFIKGSLIFGDSSQLYFKEFIDTQPQLTKYKYGYHYQKGTQFIFRYDNFRHSKNIPVHHKHLPSAGEVIFVSRVPSLEDILREIVLILPTSPNS